MLIEDPDCLKGWLVLLLKPLCEADPEALAKYVMALVKKDKPEEELRKSCLDQLDVFLQQNTSDFVDTFFKAVHDKSYLNPQPPQQQQQQPPAPHDQSSALQPQKTTAHSSSTTTTTTSSSVPSVSQSSSTSGNPVTDAPEGEVQTTSERLSSRSNRRSSRSRSPVRKSGSSRQRSDDHRRGAGGSSRYDRKRDPDRDMPKSFSSSSSRRRSTTRSRSPSPSSRRRNRSRSPATSSALLHDGSGGSKNRKRSATKSPDRDSGSKRKQQERCRDFDERGFCMRGDQCPFVDSHSDPVVLDAEPFLNHRTQSGPNPSGPAPALLPPPGTNAPGGGNMMPQEYDPRHPGTDMPPQRPGLMTMPGGVVVPGNPNTNYPPPPVGPWIHSGPPPGPGNGGVGGGYVAPGRPNLNVIIPDPNPGSDMSQQSGQGMHPIGLQSAVTVVNHNHNNSGSNNHSMMGNHGHHHAQMMHHHHQNTNPHMLHQQQQQQQQHPGMMSQMHQQQPHGQMMSGGHQQHHNGRGRGRGGFGGRGRGRGGFGGRGGGMMSGRSHDQPERCTLEIRKLPAHLNTIASLNDYFSKFGTIVNLQIKYENDPEAAVVQFASHTEAAAAHRCPEAVLGNRFIKLFWHNKDQEKQDPAPEKNGTEGTEGDDRPVDRSQAENGSENRKQAGDRDGADDQDGDEEDKNRIPVKERLDLNLKPLEDASFKLQLPKPKPSRPVLNPNLLRKSNLEKPAGEVIVPMIVKTRSEQKKEKLLKNIEIRKKTESLLDSLRKDQGSIADKMMSAKTKEERSSLKRLFDVLDLKRKKVEEDLKRISEELLSECGRGKKRPVIVKQPHGQLVKNAVEIKKKMLDRELDQISESNRKPHVAAATTAAVADQTATTTPDDGIAKQEEEKDVKEGGEESELPSDLSDPLDVNVKLDTEVDA